MIILGIGGMLNDAASAILRDGRLVAAVEQKKVARRSRPGELPEEAIAACFKLAGATADQVTWKGILFVGTLNSSVIHCREIFRQRLPANETGYYYPCRG